MTGYEWGDEYKGMTFYLREGIKWSDGAPVVVEDILFTYNDMHNNEDVEMWNWLGPVDKVVKIDNSTVRFDFPDPNPGALGAFATYAGNTWMGIQPFHYLKGWHIDYNSDADKVAKDEGYEHWYEALHYHFWWNPQKDLEKPTLMPWILSQSSTTMKIFVRNPYYHKVDRAGNQLPYIDKVFSTVVDSELYHLKIVRPRLLLKPRLGFLPIVPAGVLL
jgi:peptide/nickel transport system substrate-binding protein